MAEVIWSSHELRLEPEGPLSFCEIVPGAVRIVMNFDRPNCQVRLHSHTFDHVMECLSGLASIELEGAAQIISAGQSVLVEAHKRHSIRALQPGTVLRCVHENADIIDDKSDSIPVEWILRLTDKAA